MSTISAILTTAALASALAPGVYAWRAGRKLALAQDDPMLVEKYMGYQGKLYLYGILALVAVLFLASERLAPRLIPVIVLSSLAGSFPCRKALLEETWSFTAYLEFRLRVLLAFAGFRLLLIFTPVIVAAAGSWRSEAGAVLALVLLGWLFSGLRGFMALLGAQPLDYADMAARFEPVAAQASAPMPKLFSMAVNGGGIANAFAVAASPRPGVVFTRPLLDKLDAGEARAIFAHEMAHLEHLDGPFLMRLKLFSCGLIALALLAVPCLEDWFGPASLGFKSLLLAGLLLGFAQARFIGLGRRHEADADRRAVALCGDPEALVRGLAKIHSLNKLPKRWDANTERLSTHPSLANRIRAIREIAGVPHEPLPGPVVLGSTESGHYAIFESDRIHWLEGVPPEVELDPSQLRDRASSVATLVYGELRELLVVPDKRQGAVLSAADQKGRKWKLPLREEDVARVQAALERIDPKVNQTVAGEWWPVAVSSLLCLSVLGAALTVLGSPAFILSVLSLPPLALLSLLGTVRPRPYILGAVGLLGLGEGLTALLQRGMPKPGDKADWVLFFLLSCATFGFALYRASREPVKRGKDFGWLLLGLALFACYGWLNLASQIPAKHSAFLLYLSALAHPQAASATLGTAGLLAVAGRWRVPTALLCTLAGLHLFLQSPYFGSHFAGDPFAAEMDTLHWQTASPTLVKTLDLTELAQALRLSPQGNRFAYRKADPISYGLGLSFMVANLDGHKAEVEGVDLVFIDEDRVLALAGLSTKPEVRLLAEHQGEWNVARRWPVPEKIHAHSLQWNSKVGSWTLVGENREDGKFVKISGDLDNGQTTIKDFPSNWRGQRLWPKFLGGEDFFIAQPFYSGSTHDPAHDLLGLDEAEVGEGLVDPGRLYRELWMFEGANNKRRIAYTAQTYVECQPAPSNNSKEASAYCFANDYTRQRVGLLHIDTGRVSPLVEVPGRSGELIQQEGWIYFKPQGSQLYAINLAELRAYNFQLPIDDGYVADAAIIGRRLAVLLSVPSNNLSKLRIFQLPAF